MHKTARKPFPSIRLGIIGGGQLGKMLALEAKRLGLHVTVLDPMPKSPAAQVADEQVISGFTDPKGLAAIVAACDITTYDLEHIDTETLTALAQRGHDIQPAPSVLAIIQDKLQQKTLLLAHGLPVPRFCEQVGDTDAAFARFGYPLVQKLRRGGYDGRGVAIIKTPEDHRKALPGEAMLEEFVQIDKEIAVMVARSRSGEIKMFPPVEMVFDTEANILDCLVSPARLSEELTQTSLTLARQAVEALGGIGIFGVELLLARDGRLLINELAPRPHNSGHHTIEACLTSQYDQHLRAICGLPLGATDQLMPAVMLNLLGSADAYGPPLIEGLYETLEIPGVYVHIYGKGETKPLRKMGHVTIMDQTLDGAMDKARRVKDLLVITSKEAKKEL